MNGTDKNVVLLELGVGEMTPSIIKLPFWAWNDKKEEVIPESKPKARPLEAVEIETVEMTPEEYRAMIELAKNAGPDDCEMCGS